MVAQASTIDLSQRGLRLLANFALRPGQDIEAILYAGASDGKFYRVVWVRKSESGHTEYEAGLELLTRPNSEGDV